MSVRIEEITGDHIPGLCSLYNETLVRIPHGNPVDDALLNDALAAALGSGKGPERLTNERVFVAMRDQTTVGFVHIANDAREDRTDWGAIRFLMYRPGDPPVGQELLDLAHKHLQERNTTYAFDQYYRYRFHQRSHFYLSDRYGHIQSLLQMNGYERRQGEIFFDWDDFDVDPGKPPVEVEMRRTVGDETECRPGLKVGAFLGEEEIAACHITSCGQWSSEPKEQARLFVGWLGVEDVYQGRGLGRYALLFTMKAAQEIGYRHAAISTSVRNHRAFVFYSNIGFHVTDMTYGWMKNRKSGREE